VNFNNLPLSSAKVNIEWSYTAVSHYDFREKLPFITTSKRPKMHHSFNVLVHNVVLHVSAFWKAIIRESDMNMLRWCPVSWEAEKDGSCIL
jgi:hypothetical protein